MLVQDLKDKDCKKPVDLVNFCSDVGKMFGAINYEKAAILWIAALLATVCSIAFVYLAISININIAQFRVLLLKQLWPLLHYVVRVTQ
ncbi:MAG: hypothetical protein ACR5K2_03765 [Wolbachia sp.]